MQTAIELVWWVGLVGALLPTLVILKLAFLVVGRLRDILKLAALTNVAARGVAANVAAVDALRGVGALIAPVPGSLGAATGPLRGIAEALDGSAGA